MTREAPGLAKTGEDAKKSSSGHRSNLQQRILTAAFLILPTLYLAAFAPRWLFGPALLIAAGLCLYEYFKLAERAGLEGFPLLGYLTGLAILTAQLWEIVDLLQVLVLAVVSLPFLALAFERNLKRYLSAVSVTLFGALYIALGLSWLAPLRFDSERGGGMVMIFLLVVIWMGDVVAYFVGRRFGRRRFAPAVSPNKTVEGALGGLVGSLAGGAGFIALFGEPRKMAVVLGVTAVVAVAGQLGDLAESALKRSAGVKDSSSFLPGHGGLLDRLDSLLVAAPVFWLAGAAERIEGL